MATTLNLNAIYSVLSNMIISQLTFANPIGGLDSSIVDANRVDGTLYGDTKNYISIDLIHSREWLNDAEATNLLALKRNKEVKEDHITLDQFRVLAVTTDAMLTKQAFMNEGNFANFNAVQISMIRDGLKAYDVTEYNTFVGTNGTQEKTITVGAGQNEALVLSNGVANILDDMAELSRDYNYNGFVRAFGKEDVDIIFNKSYLNQWKYMDLPIVFHKDGILADHKAMNQKYFGRDIEASDAGSGKVINASGEYDPTKGTIRVRHECEVTYSGDTKPTKYFAGDEIKSGATIDISGADFDSDDLYIEDPSIVGIILGKGAVPYMSAAESSTAFYNPLSLTNTQFLIFGRNTLKALGEKPYVVIKKASA